MKTSFTPGASKHYGLLWWNNNDGAMSGVPRDAFWSWGLGDSFILVIPSKELVVARAGRSWQGGWKADYRVWPIFQAVSGAVRRLRGRLRLARAAIATRPPGAPGLRSGASCSRCGRPALRLARGRDGGEDHGTKVSGSASARTRLIVRYKV